MYPSTFTSESQPCLRQSTYRLAVHHTWVNPNYNVTDRITYNVLSMLLIIHRGVFHKHFSTVVQQTNKNWTQLDLTFCENEESKRSKINEKWDQLYRKPT